jgi:hypothetical protein
MVRDDYNADGSSDVCSRDILLPRSCALDLSSSSSLASPVGNILIPSFSSSINSSFLPHLQCPSLVEVIDLPSVPNLSPDDSTYP